MPATRLDDPGQHAVDFFENRLVHTKGTWAGKPFRLEPWQSDDLVRPLFGSVRPDGTRQYRQAYIEVPRKNGKSELAAGVALKLLFADGEPGAEIYGAAADKEQASIVFNVAKAMVEASPALRNRARIYKTKVIEVPKTGSVYRALSADAYTKHGFNAHGIIFDEVHVQPNRELWDVLTTSTGTRTQPLTFAITTAGHDMNTLCGELHEYAQGVLDGVIDDPKFFAYIRGAVKDDDWLDEAVWRKANPALGVFRSLEEMRDLANKAKHSPALQNTFRRLYLDQWVAQKVRWLDLAKWDASAGQVDVSELAGRPCFGGLDLASSTDLAALVLVFPFEQTLKVLCRFWIPESGMLERSKRDRVNYEAWAAAGYIKATPGDVIDYKFIRHEVEAIADECQLVELAYDRWGATQLVQELGEAGVTVVPFGQGFASMSAPTKDTLTLVLQQRLHHGGHPVLRWNADNMKVVIDPAGNVKPDKSRGTARIDGMVALIMAVDRATRNGTSVYEERGLVVL